MSSLGHLRLASATLGSNSECQIYSNGVATFLVGNPTFTSNVSYPDIGSTTWSTDTGLNITSNSTPSEALSKIDCWLETYLLDAPPVLTSSSSATAVEYIQVSWSNPTQRKLAFLSNTYVPQITKLRADVVPSGSSWTGGSQWTINLQTPTTTPTCTSLRIVLDYNSGTSTLSSGTYYFYGTSSSNRIAQATSYDVRVYAENEATLSGSKTPRYLVFSNLATLSAGTPSAPTSVSVSSISQTTATASWTAPSTPDTSSNATPYIQQYKVNVTANSSVRYGNVLTTQTTPQLTANAAGSNASTSLGLTTLNPGTSYNITVQARNTLNTSFGNASSPATTFTTSYPTAPSWPTGSITLSNQASLIYGSGSTGYTLDGNTAVSPILNYNTMLTTPPVSSAVSNFRLNYTLADTASSTGSVEAHAGPGGSESTASVTTVGFGRTFTTGNTDVGAARLVFSAEGDAYSGSSSGFYKQGTVYIAAINPASYYPASNSAYRMYLKFLPTGGSTVTGGNVSFYVDRLNALPSVVGSGITTATSTTTYITGVPTFTSSTTFGFQTTVRSLAYQFLRSDKVHFTAQIETSSGTALSSTLSVTKSNVNGSTYSYYTATGDTYSLSATKHNTSGAVLTIPAPDIQFWEFALPLNSASSVFDEALRLRITPYNMYGTGTAAVQSGQVSTSNGSKQSIRIDTSSVTAIASLTGTLMSCGTGQYPTTGYTSAIDHSQSIVGTDQLQLVNGSFQTPGVATGYKDYSDYYFPSTLSQPNYSSISSSGYRYLCLRYQSLKTSTYDSVTVTFSCSGLTLTPASDTANFRLYLKVVDSTTTPWVSATAAIGASGYDAISSDGQGAMDNSNASISGGSASMRIYVPTGTSASSTVYLRLGLDMTQSQYVSGIALTAN